jgi:hypothetical protein
MPIIVEAGNNKRIDLIIEEYSRYQYIGEPPYRRYFSLPTGNYSIHSYFYYFNISSLGIMSEYFAYEDNYDYLESNHFKFRLEQNEIPGIEKIKVELELTKSQFYEREPLTGTINITNNNLFEITLSHYQQNTPPGNHFKIYSMNDSNVFIGLNQFDLYPIQLQAKSTSIMNFEIEKYVLEPIQYPENYIYSNLSIGKYSINAFFILYSNFGNEGINYTYLWSNAVEFEILFNITDLDNNGFDKPRPGGQFKGLKTGTALATLTVSVIIVIISFVFITATEIGKYGFFSSVAPLYTKQRKKKDENSGYIKGLVHGYIDGNPGENYNSIKRALKMNNGTLAYYLKVLLRENTIKSERDGILKRFYPTEGRITRDVLDLSDIQQDIFDVILDNPGIFQKDILERLDISQQRLNYQIKQMSEARLIKVERDGKRTKCYVIEEKSD